MKQITKGIQLAIKPKAKTTELRLTLVNPCSSYCKIYRLRPHACMTSVQSGNWGRLNHYATRCFAHASSVYTFRVSRSIPFFCELSSRSNQYRNSLTKEMSWLPVPFISLNNNRSGSKNEVTPMPKHHGMKGEQGRGGQNPIPPPDLGTRWKWVVSFTPAAVLPRTICPGDHWIGG
jgi:hypothetical protein